MKIPTSYAQAKLYKPILSIEKHQGSKQRRLVSRNAQLAQPITPHIFKEINKTKEGVGGKGI